MRFLLPAVALLLALSALAGWARGWDTSANPATSPNRAPAGAAVPAKAGSSPGSSADNEAAAKHAKRTACINQARSKKLVGAQKTAFIRSCTGPP